MIECVRESALPHHPDGWPHRVATVGIAATPARTSYESLLTWFMLMLLDADAAIAAQPTPENNPSPAPPRGNHLTAREREVLRLVTMGMTNMQIAERLFVSRRTVDQHIASIFNRLGVSSRAAATRFAVLYDLC